jgi:hypothetical protein
MLTYEKEAHNIADQLKGIIDMRFWIERSKGPVIQEVLRRAAELNDMEYKCISLPACYPTDLEDMVRSLTNKPGILVLDEYDKADKYIRDLASHMALHYEYRKMRTSSVGALQIPIEWKFVILTEPRAWIDVPELHKLLRKIH